MLKSGFNFNEATRRKRRVAADRAPEVLVKELRAHADDGVAVLRSCA